MIAQPRPKATATTLAGLALLMLLAGGPATAKADEPRADPVEPGARSLIEKVVGVYKNLAAYTDRGTLNFSIRTEKGAQDRASHTRSITFARPNKLVLDYEKVRLISDGREQTIVLVPDKQYVVTPAPEKVGIQTVAAVQAPGLPPGSFLAGEGGLPIALMLELLAGDDPLKTIVEGTDRVALEPERQHEGKPIVPVFVDQTNAPDYRMLVDPETKLLRGIELAYDLDRVNARRPEGQKLQEVSLAWTAGPIGQEVPGDAFTFAIPSDFKKVEAAAPEPSPLDDLVGKPAPEFSLSILDGPGRTRTLTRADLKGKVVLLDFWATWCAPCMAELPEIQKLVDDYAAAKKEVVVIAVSQDDDPADLPGLRKLVEETLAGKSLELAGGPVGRVALDPGHETGEAFRIEALPTVVILDQQGVVRSAHVGFNPEIRTTLTAEIDALLAGPAPAPSSGAEAAAPRDR